MQLFVSMWICLCFIIAIGSIVSIICFIANNKDSRTPFVPPRPNSKNIEKVQNSLATENNKFCIECNAPLTEGSKFCSACGKKQVKEYVAKFTNQDGTDAMINKINQWFADNLELSNVNCSVELSTKFGILVNESILNSVSFKYELSQESKKIQYCFVELDYTSLYRKSTESILAQWQQSNPKARIIKTFSSIHSRGQVGHTLLGGIGALNHIQLYIFFLIDR